MFNIATFIACQTMLNSQLQRQRDNRKQMQRRQEESRRLSQRNNCPEELETSSLDDNSLTFSCSPKVLVYENGAFVYKDIKDVEGTEMEEEPDVNL